MHSMISLLALGCISGTNAWADFAYGNNVLPTYEEHKFRSWMQDYDIRYSTKEEYLFRFEAFKTNLKEIQA